MKILKIVTMAAVVAAMATLLTACSDHESYSERLDDERHACNAFLANFEIRDVPADSVFETGSNAPFYRLDDEGNVYMQVINAGDRKTDKAKDGETIYFRYTRYDLSAWYNEDHVWNGTGNADNMSAGATYFLYNNYTLQVSAQYGYGIQMPLNYLGVNCEVNLIIKSQYGFTSEISYVTPFYYHIRYFHSQI